MSKFLKPKLVEGNWFLRGDFTKEELSLLGDYYGVFNKNTTLTARAHTHLSYENGVLIGDDVTGISGAGMEVVRDDMFEPVPQEPLQPSETSVTPSQYNYTKCEFKHVGEALTAFCEGVALYYSDSEGYNLCEDTQDCLTASEANILYTKQETPWYDLVSKSNPVYVTEGQSFVKIIGAESETVLTMDTGIVMDCKEAHKPLTDEMVNDIVQTMKKFNGGAE